MSGDLVVAIIAACSGIVVALIAVLPATMKERRDAKKDREAGTTAMNVLTREIELRIEYNTRADEQHAEQLADKNQEIKWLRSQVRRQVSDSP